MHGTPDSGARQDSPTLQVALNYAALGWRVVPVWRACEGVCGCWKADRCDRPGKHPRTRHGHQGATTDPGKIRSWKWESANVGIATGRESGLLVIDIDPRNGGQEGVAALQRELGPLPPGPVVQTGGGGRHLYFRHPDGEIRKSLEADGVDIKTDGGFVVAPPSIHASGEEYRWTVRPEKVPPPELPEAWQRFLAAPLLQRQHPPVTETTKDHKRPQKTTKDTPARAAARSESKFAIGSIKEFIEQCIQKTLPEKPGQRHAAVFRLARYLQGHTEVAKWPLRQLRPIVDRWFELAVENLGREAINATEDENWWDFSEGWGQVKYPGEDGLMTMLLERAKQAEPPAMALQYRSPETRLLIALCRELQQELGDEPFFLATTTIEKLFDLNRMRAWRWLQGLVRGGVLECVDRGSSEERRPGRFRYLGD